MGVSCPSAQLLAGYRATNEERNDGRGRRRYHNGTLLHHQKEGNTERGAHHQRHTDARAGHRANCGGLGYAPEEIPNGLPHLSLAAVFDALSYYCDHKEEINMTTS